MKDNNSLTSVILAYNMEETELNNRECHFVNTLQAHSQRILLFKKRGCVLVSIHQFYLKTSILHLLVLEKW